MNRLNYFNPYDSKAGSHEDQLTRAYFVLLKHSSHAFFTFIEYGRSKHKISGKEKPITIIDFLEQGWDFETQKGNPVINTNYLLSILITDSQIETTDSSVQSSERNARYDGIITFGSNLTMGIENKPRSGNVWFGQLNPSRQNLAEGTIVYSNPGLASIKRTEKLSHMVSCFGVRSQLGKSSPARCECAGGCRSIRYNRRSRCALGSDWQKLAGRPH